MLLQTTFTLIGTEPAGRCSWTLELPPKPGSDEIRHALGSVFPGAVDKDGPNFERVAVLHEGKATDLFVDECGHIKGLERNEEATAIYRAAYLAQHPGTDAESLPSIVGPAVLCSRRIWF